MTERIGKIWDLGFGFGVETKVETKAEPKAVDIMRQKMYIECKFIQVPQKAPQRKPGYGGKP